MNKLPNPTLCGAVLGFGLLASGAVFAQASTGAIEGDAVAGDSVTIRNIHTEHSLAYAVAGKRFHFGRLPVGIYEVVIHHADGRTDAPILARARLGETVQVN